MIGNKFDKKGIWVRCHHGGGEMRPQWLEQLATPSLCWTLSCHAMPCQRTRNRGLGRAIHTTSWMGESLSLHIPLLSPYFLPSSFPPFPLALLHLSRLSPEFWLLLDYPLFVPSFELRLQIVSSVYSSRREKLFYPVYL